MNGTDTTPDTIADEELMRRRLDLAKRLRALEPRLHEAIRRQHQAGATMVALAARTGMSVLAIRMICRPEVRDAHNNRRRKPNQKGNTND